MTTPTLKDDKRTVTKDWNAWLGPKDDEKHRVCSACYPVGSTSPAVALCGRVRATGVTAPYNPLTPHCDICQQACADRVPCIRCGKPASP